MKARARNTDPPTSHAAAREVEKKGHAADQRAICLAEARKNPGQTAAEIARATGLERHAPSRRLPELRDAGLLRNGETIRCSVTRRLSITWLPFDGESETDTHRRARTKFKMDLTAGMKRLCSDLAYELSYGIHTYHQCPCKRTVTRAGRCWLCHIEEYVREVPI